MAGDKKETGPQLPPAEYHKGVDRIIGLVMHLEEAGATEPVIDAHIRVEWNHHTTCGNDDMARGIADACRTYFKKS